MTYGDTVVIDGELGLISEIDGDIGLILPVDGELGTITKVTEHDLPSYTGPTVITPSEETKVLATSEKAVSQNIIINPVPDNYGRLIWAGGILTVY